MSTIIIIKIILLVLTAGATFTVAYNPALTWRRYIGKKVGDVRREQLNHTGCLKFAAIGVLLSLYGYIIYPLVAIVALSIKTGSQSLAIITLLIITAIWVLTWTRKTHLYTNDDIVQATSKRDWLEVVLFSLPTAYFWYLLLFT